LSDSTSCRVPNRRELMQAVDFAPTSVFLLAGLAHTAVSHQVAG
jgi:hypothetical protein